jgi:polyhydroxyalkanoate synthesis regulator phasin
MVSNRGSPPDSDDPERSFPMKINDDVRKVMMAGIGALSAVAEKTQETVDSLARKGEEALDHGQVLNERMRHKIKQAMRDGEPDKGPGKDEIISALDHLSPEELKAVKDKLKSMRSDGE